MRKEERIMDQSAENFKPEISPTRTTLERALAASKLPPIIERAIAAGCGSEIVPVAPPGALLSPNSKISQACVGKIPMLFDRRNGWWRGYSWTRHNHSREELECCAINGGGFGAQGRKVFSLDCDVNNEEQVKSILKLLHELGWHGAVRYRRSSPRILVTLTCKAGFVPSYRYLSWREPNGAEHTVECLGRGKFYVIYGTHPKSGDRYQWIKNLDPFTFGLDNHTKTDKAMLDEFFALLADTIETFGWGTIFKRGGGTGNAGQRKSIDDPSRWAPTPQHVLDLLKEWPNTPENVPTHNHFVAATAAIKTAFGRDREDYYPDFLEWATDYPGIEEEYVRGRWDSFA